MVRSLIDVLADAELSKDFGIFRSGDNINVLVRERDSWNSVITIYPGTLFAEFLDFDFEEWDELGWAIRDKYGECSLIADFYKTLNEEGYHLIW